MRLHVIHTTRYAYQPAVETARHVACLIPRATPHQQLLSHALHVEPEPSAVQERTDVWGNRLSHFSLMAAHESLSVTAESRVRTAAPSWPAADLPWEAAREAFRYHAGAAWLPEAEFSYPSPHVPRHEAFAAYARSSFTPGASLHEAAWSLMQRIHAEMAYASNSTDVHTPATEALAQRRGVCQDFAHILLGALRAMGLAARYVSGYLLTQPPPGQPRLIGADASHAWVSLYVPAHGGEPGGWWDLDPTNGRAAGEDYVTVAWGRDFSDVSPMRGVIHGGARHTLAVEVTVTPEEETEP